MRKTIFSMILFLVCFAGDTLVQAEQHSTIFHSNKSKTELCTPILVSTNGGKNWTVRTKVPCSGLYTIASNDKDQWLATGQGIELTSYDGINWKEHFGIPSCCIILSTVWHENKWVAVGFKRNPDGSYQGLIFTSPNGVAWTGQKIPFEWNKPVSRLYSVASNGKMLVAGGSSGLDVTGVILTSKDGVIWTRQENIDPDIEKFYGISAAPNGKWVGTTDIFNVRCIVSSPNGTDWTLQQLQSFGYFWSSPVWNGHDWIIAGFLGSIWKSTDPEGKKLWNNTYNLGYIFFGAAWSGENWILVGSDKDEDKPGVLVGSDNGTTWVPGIIDPKAKLASLEALAWNKKTGMGIAVGGCNHDDYEKYKNFFQNN